ncbi:peptidylprolyl isomerase [Silvibacterium acidisoli]|uniref:peptidylprolyl isomerase n=1 Tax=Acidobacteriaceae bacterium ZG23-2 TaxID=2883246 RepID=UPI00406CF4AB
MRRLLANAICGLVLVAGGRCCAQADTQGKPVVLDHVIGVINGDVLLQSDVDEEQRFAALEPFSTQGRNNTPERAGRRLANRTLILQQMKEQQLNTSVSDEEVQKSLAELRQHLPTCRRYQCSTDSGWKNFLAANGLTESEVDAHWKQRLEILKFIDIRFRTGIRITKEEIDTYYQKSILPVYAKQNEKPPAESLLAPRIQEILLQQHVNVLLQDWLKSLRDEGSVQILDPAYGQSSGNNSDEDN